MNLKSIRWRLPFSYAGIALLSALALGLVLLSTLRGYYQRQERGYLQNNAEQIGPAVAQLLQSHLPASVMQDQVTSWSFFLQARLQVISPDYAILADSGVPDIRQVYTVSSRPGTQGDMLTRQGEPMQSITIAGGSSPTLTLPAEGGIFIQRGQTISGTGAMAFTDCFNETGAAIPCPAASSILSLGGPITQPFTASVTTGPVGFSMFLAPSLYGYNLVPEDSQPLQRSHQVIDQPVRDRSGSLLGTIRLSDGPAYGEEIVASVTRGWLAASAVAVLLAAGVGWLISRQVTTPLFKLSDVTARMAEGELSARAEVDSPDEFGRLGQSFNEMADRVEAIVGALRNFVADAAHELNTPLTALQTNLELASGDADPDRRAGYLTNAQEQVHRLGSLVNGLLELSRLETTNTGLAHAPVDLNHLVQETGEIYASRTEQAGISFSLELPWESLIVEGNEAQIRRLLENLLENALKFSRESGSIQLQLSREGQQAQLIVEDTGIGIPEEDLPYLFERFHRGRNAAGYPGNGLGLAIVKAIVEVHHGQVRVENTGQGALFELSLPLR